MKSYRKPGKQLFDYDPEKEKRNRIILQDFHKGMSKDEIARKYELSRHQIWKVLWILGIEGR